MNQWYGLVKKEWRLSRNSFLIVLAVQIAIMIAITGYYQQSGNTQALVGTAATIFSLQFFYLPVFMFLSLNAEAKQFHLWMHNPQPISLMILAKLAVGIIAMTASIVTSAAFSLFAVNENGGFLFPGLSEQGTTLFQLLDGTQIAIVALSVFLFFGSISVYFTMWMIFIWTVYHSLLNRLGKWGWGVAFGIPIVFNWLERVLQSTGLYRQLQNGIGGIELRELSTIYETLSDTVFPTTIVFPTFLYLLYGLVTVALFYLSVRLIDKKVEV